MKKALATILALIMCLMMAVPAFAADYSISGDFVITTENADCYTVAGTTVTFHDGAVATLSGSTIYFSYGGEVTSGYSILIEENATVALTLNNFTVDRTGSWSNAIELKTGASLALTLNDGTTNNIIGGQESSAIRVPEGASLTITGTGTLNASVANSTSMAGCAVIGSQYNNPNGNIRILDATVNISFSSGAGNIQDKAAIGTTYWSADATGNGLIVIENATVNSSGLRIGGRSSSQSNVIVDNATVDGTINANRLDIVNGTGTISGSFTLSGDYTLGVGKTIIVPNGATLVLEKGATFTNNGTIVIEEGGVQTAPPGTNLGTIINRGQVKYDSTQVTYTVSPSYTVTIPEKVTLGQTVTISAEDVRVAKGSRVEVSLTGINNGDSQFTLSTAEGESITYTVQDASRQTVAINDTVLAVDPQISDKGSAELTFFAPTDITYAGTYTGTVTFTVSVKDAA